MGAAYGQIFQSLEFSIQDNLPLLLPLEKGKKSGNEISFRLKGELTEEQIRAALVKIITDEGLRSQPGESNKLTVILDPNDVIAQVSFRTFAQKLTVAFTD